MVLLGNSYGIALQKHRYYIAFRLLLSSVLYSIVMPSRTYRYANAVKRSHLNGKKNIRFVVYMDDIHYLCCDYENLQARKNTKTQKHEKNLICNIDGWRNDSFRMRHDGNGYGNW